MGMVVAEATKRGSGRNRAEIYIHYNTNKPTNQLRIPHYVRAPHCQNAFLIRNNQAQPYKRRSSFNSQIFQSSSPFVEMEKTTLLLDRCRFNSQNERMNIRRGIRDKKSTLSSRGYIYMYILKFVLCEGGLIKVQK